MLVPMSNPSRRVVRVYPSRRYLDVLDPSPLDIELYDIAHALSVIPRYGGHTAKPYYVGEHALTVAVYLMRKYGDPELAMCGLHHDDTEYVLGDIVQPVKRSGELDGYVALESRWEQAIADSLRLPFLPSALDEVKEADKAVLEMEMTLIRDNDWRTASAPDSVRQAFLLTHHQLEVAIDEKHNGGPA